MTTDTIARLAQASGVDAAVAAQAFAQFMAFLAKHGPPPQVAALFAAMPEAKAAAAAAPEVTPTGVMVSLARLVARSNVFVDLGLKLTTIGLGVTAIRPFGEELLQIGRERVGEPVMGPLVASMKSDALAALKFGQRAEAKR